MTLPTHTILGLIIGKVTGNYSVAIASSILPDIDHFVSYIKNGIIKKPKIFWKTVTNKKDQFGDQRGYLHNILVLLFLSFILYFLISKQIFISLILGLSGHIILDALDNSDYWPFFPNKRINLRGPIKYISFFELVFVVFLLVIYFII